MAVRSSRALVLGGADTVWDDARAALKLLRHAALRFDLFVAINSMIVDWPDRLDLAVTLHPEKLKNWLPQREGAGHPAPCEVWAHKFDHGGKPVPGVTHATPDWQGSSGLFAIKVALEKGASHIVLAGIPMDETVNHYVRQAPWSVAERYRKFWIPRKREIAPFLRSMSGWTASEFGKPDRDWLACDNAPEVPAK